MRTYMMSQPKDLDQMELNVTLSQEDFPVRTSQLQETKQASKVHDPDYGGNCAELLATYNQDTRSWRTSQHSLVETTGGGLEKFLETWPRSGMTVNGIAYRLEPLVLPMSGTVFGLSLPTPRVSRGFTNPTLGKERNDCLTTTLLGKPVLGLRPKAQFVEWMMGYFIGWTELKDSGTP